jgi:hypothetical protein
MSLTEGGSTRGDSVVSVEGDVTSDGIGKESIRASCGVTLRFYRHEEFFERKCRERVRQWHLSAAASNLQAVGNFSRSHPSTPEHFQGKHRFEHWYRDNQVYLITARTRDGVPVFESEAAKAVFWDRFAHYTSIHDFEVWIVSLLVNHYHAVGYLRVGIELKEMMRKIH